MIRQASLALLRQCVREDGGALRASLADPATDVDGWLAFAHAHRLAGFVCGRLEQLGLLGMLPPAQRAAAVAAALLERARSERLVAELRRLGELLGPGDVRVLFLKGPLLAWRFYGGLEARATADLDLLTRDRDLARVEALLLGGGYAPAFRVLLSRRLSRHFSHHFEYRREDLPLDVHWAFQRHFTFSIDYDRVWATAERVEVDGRSYEVLAPEYELVLQLLGVLTDVQVGKLALRSVVDIHRILRAMEGATEWDEFFARRKRERILRASAYVLALVCELLECREEFPLLAAALRPRLAGLPSLHAGTYAALRSRPFSPGQKLLALRLYETHLPAALSWWLVSLPFRLAVYGTRRSA